MLLGYKIANIYHNVLSLYTYTKFKLDDESQEGKQNVTGTQKSEMNRHRSMTGNGAKRDCEA